MRKTHGRIECREHSKILGSQEAFRGMICSKNVYDSFYHLNIDYPINMWVLLNNLGEENKNQNDP